MRRARTRGLAPPSDQVLPGARVQRGTYRGETSSLVGEEISITGLSAVQIDVMLRIHLASGRTHSAILRPSSPAFLVPEETGHLQFAWSYVLLGIQHILQGIDHLLFVLGLILIVSSAPMLLKTITSFTLAHSITLAVATLGYASTPLPPLNAAIALSILFLGPEIVTAYRGQSSFTIRHPWVVAFAFGLLHGFGFASGLDTIGMVGYELGEALLSFNIGVEIGQLIFVVLILAVTRSFRVLEVHWPGWVRLVPGYTVGSLGAYWTIQRTIMMLGGV